ncbi:hypothetical protein M4951_08375 [Blastopirellula sp. J2-11]|uniref:hypothetical protein n=1 Tax=Blastopirellula sp. J2-11 TaxID=2943192 RepID=UPI0021CAB07B|nr:hypothetical protein [Blastopirellula sp. J2-11]UUO08317.1 hypothetical protein M4951_08375 [Blastopirellula sp. J2-11]
MCIFSQPVMTVNKTRIFARTTSASSQFLVYQMNYESRDENAMILPLPVRRPANDDNVQFINLEAYPKFFDELDDGFPYSRSQGIGCSAGPVADSRSGLAVFEVGNYLASFVPSLADFSRLDPRFVLPEETWAQIPQYQDYGFAVFQLASGAIQPHPMALEFATALRDSIYFPTMHIHDGEVHKSEEFDHVLYLQHAGFDSQVHGYINSDVADSATGLVRSKHVAKNFTDVDRASGVVLPDLLVHRQIVRGELLNQDIEIATTGDPTYPALNFRWLKPLAPWMLGAAAVGWFLMRRAKIRKRQSEDRSAADVAPRSEDD